MLGLVDLQILLEQAEIAALLAPEGVLERAGRVEEVDVVAERVGARLGQALDPLAGGADRVVARAGLVERREDLLEGAAADLALAAGGELEPPLAVAGHHVLVLQAGEERFEIDLLGQVPLLLEIAHPVHRLLDVAAGRQHELVEQAQEVEAGEERL